MSAPADGRTAVLERLFAEAVGLLSSTTNEVRLSFQLRVTFHVCLKGRALNRGEFCALLLRFTLVLLSGPAVGLFVEK